MKKVFLIFFSIVSLNIEAKTYNSDGVKFMLEKIFEGSEVIWGFDFVNSKEANALIFSEREGKLKYLDLKSKKTHEIAGAPKVFTESQGGLLDVYMDHKTNNLYLTYSEPVGSKATTSLFKGALSSDNKTLKGERLFQAKAIASGGIHFGSRVVIDKNGFIFMSVGERNDRDRAQELTNHQGKILRLTQEGVAPKDNPFVGVKDALPEIWTYGHRNPQGLIFDGDTLIEAEFGPRGGDEVNIITKGKNYGWPVATYGKEYWGPSIGAKEKAGMEQPLYHWVPSISPSGIMIYSGSAFPKFVGNVFLANLAGSHLRRVTTDKNRKIIKEDKLLEDLEERFRQVKVGPDGLIYFSTDSGKIYRMAPAS